MIICMIAGFRPVHWSAVPIALGFMLMIAIVFGGLGTAIGSVLKDMQGFQLIMNFLVMPIFFLSGALFPLTNLPKALGVLTSADPLSYGIDGVRGSLSGLSHFGPGLDFIVLCVVACLFLALSTRCFSRIQI